VVRVNAGYERWWEARKAWGGIINESRNLAIAGLTYGPADAQWRDQFVRWTIAFAYAVRAELRGEHPVPGLERLLGFEEAGRATAVPHAPSYVSARIAALLQEAKGMGMDLAGALAAENQRAALIDHLGTCERILRAPLPKVNSIVIRRFVVLFLGTFPFPIMLRIRQQLWLTPLLTMLVAYLILSLDQMGVELQNPFARSTLSHLPLERFVETVERDLMALLDQGTFSAAHQDRPA
jgi:ion channel-forming bestrophin family protein